MANSLDDILGGEAVPEAKPTETEVTQPVAAETPEQQDEPQDRVTETLDGKKMVPLEALTESRGKAKRYTEQVAEFEKTVSGLSEQNTHLARQVTELREFLQRIPVPRQEQQPPPEKADFYIDPEMAFQQRFHDAQARSLGPVQQQLMAVSETVARLEYGADNVSQAERAFLTALQRGQVRQGDADYSRVVDSPNRYAAAVQWYSEQRKGELLRDPRVSSLIDKMSADPSILDRLEQLQSSPQQPQQQQPAALAPRQAAPAAIMPTPGFANTRSVGGSRDGPNWGGPQSIGTIFSTNR